MITRHGLDIDWFARSRFVSVPAVTHGIDSDLGPQHVAEEILHGHGADLGSARRGRGWTNATWLTDELVIRVATEPGTADLLREERLVRLLPAEVGYPTIVDSGVRQGHEWVLTRRVAGENLEEVWPLLDHTDRSRAIEQMWERARHIHRVDVAAAAPHARSRSPFFPESPSEVTAALDRLVKAGELTTAQARGLGRSLDRFWTALPGARKVLNHGDLCTPNTLWNNGEVVALLDFEFAVIAPVAIDLNEVAKMAFGPSNPDDRAPLRDVVHGIVESTLDTAGGPDVLVGYSIMLEMWMLANELAADDTDEAERADSAAMLMAFAEGDGGYFAPLLAGLR
ncbi:phosphotransferase family protein [Streptomyces scopuliridis]